MTNSTPQSARIAAIRAELQRQLVEAQARRDAALIAATAQYFSN